MDYSKLPAFDYEIAYGGVIVKDNLILLREPANHFGGYVWTFPKGRCHTGETPEQTALREVLEETGVIARIISAIPGVYTGDVTVNHYFLMEPIKETGIFDWETNAIRWASCEEAFQLINKTYNLNGLKRDLAILSVVVQMVSSFNKSL